jgi:hypothetical protein
MCSNTGKGQGIGAKWRGYDFEKVVDRISLLFQVERE